MGRSFATYKPVPRSPMRVVSCVPFITQCSPEHGGSTFVPNTNDLQLLRYLDPLDYSTTLHGEKPQIITHATRGIRM